MLLFFSLSIKWQKRHFETTDDFVPSLHLCVLSCRSLNNARLWIKIDVTIEMHSLPQCKRAMKYLSILRFAILFDSQGKILKIFCAFSQLISNCTPCVSTFVLNNKEIDTIFFLLFLLFCHFLCTENHKSVTNRGILAQIAPFALLITLWIVDKRA